MFTGRIQLNYPDEPYQNPVQHLNQNVYQAPKNIPKKLSRKELGQTNPETSQTLAVLHFFNDVKTSSCYIFFTIFF